MGELECGTERGEWRSGLGLREKKMGKLGWEETSWEKQDRGSGMGKLRWGNWDGGGGGRNWD